MKDLIGKTVDVPWQIIYINNKKQRPQTSPCGIPRLTISHEEE
jgi:hypothetical protein